MQDELWYLFCRHRLIVLNFCTSPDDALYLYQVSGKYLEGFQRYWEDAICILKFSKGDNSVNSVGGFMVLICSTLSDSVLFSVPRFVKVSHRISELRT